MRPRYAIYLPTSDVRCLFYTRGFLFFSTRVFERRGARFEPGTDGGSKIRSRPHLSHTSVRARPQAMSFMRDTSREVEHKALRERRKNNSKRAKGAPSPVDGQLQFRNLDEVIATDDRGGENARVHERSSDIQGGNTQTRLKNNSPGGSRNPRESAVPLGGAGAHHQGPMHDGRVGTPGGPRGDGAAYDSGDETWNDKRETGATGDATDRFRAQRNAVQGPATPQPVATVTVHRAPAADALKALAEYGSDSEDDNRVAGGEDFHAGFHETTPESSAAGSDKSIARAEEGEPELRSVPSGPPTSKGKLPSVELCDGCKTELENLKRINDPRDTLQSFRPCHMCLSAAIRVCRPCQADIHDDGSRDNGGHGIVNYPMLKNKTPKLQIQRHRMTDGALVCKQCYTQLDKLDKKRKRAGLPPRAPKAVADTPNEMSAGTRARSFSSVSLEHTDHSPDEIVPGCPACDAGCGELTQPMSMSEVEQDRLRLLNRVDDLEYSLECVLDRVAELERRAGIRRPGVSTYTRQVFTNRPSV